MLPYSAELFKKSLFSFKLLIKAYGSQLSRLGGMGFALRKGIFYNSPSSVGEILLK